MNYLIRSERIRLIQHRASVEIVEGRPKRWRPHDGDMLLVTRGSNLQLEFSLFVRVLAITTEEIRLDDGPAVRLIVKGELISEGHNTLGQMMYSLIRVANFSRPGLNLRHHAQIRDEDLQRVLNGDIYARRSLYFGVLQFLPRQWRDYVDLAAREYSARRALASVAVMEAGRRTREDPRWPLDSLLEVLDREFVEFVGLAARAGARRTALPLELRSPLAEVDPTSGRPNTWIDQFLGWAQRNGEQLVRLREAIATASQEHEEEGGTSWRIHHW